MKVLSSRSSSSSSSSSSSVQAETRRLRRALVAILVSASPAALVYGCDGNGSSVASSSTAESSSGAGGGRGTMHDAAVDQASADANDAGDAGFDALATEDGSDSSDGSDGSDGSDAAQMDCTISYGDRDAGPDAPEACYVELPCGLPQGITTVGCVLYVGQEYFGCSLADDAGCTADAYTPPESGVLIANCYACPFGSGRRFDRRRDGRARRRPSTAARSASDPLVAYFTRMAEEEQASVTAFEVLGAELSRHGAPADLIGAAGRSRQDEIRHANVMRRWARRSGARVDAIHPARGDGPRPAPDRSFRDFASENVVEGCVRETFGAMVLAWQSAHAVDPSLRRSLARVAEDELRHAGLAWAVDRWARERLDPGGRRAIERATRRALADLRRAAKAPSDTHRLLGAPPPRVHLAFVERLADMLRERDSE